MGCRRNFFPFLPLLSWLAAARAGEDGSDFPRPRRRRRLGGGRPTETTGVRQEETREGKDETKNNFYDLTLLTEDEKLRMIKTAYSLTRYGDSIDWDKQRDNFVEAVRRSRSRSDDAGANDDAYEGRMDDTLGDEAFENVANDGNDDAYDGEVDDTIDGGAVVERKGERRTVSVTGVHASTATKLQPASQTTPRRLQKNNIDGDVFGGYEYSKGACPDPGSLGVPCAPNNLSALCDKYNEKRGSFRACLDACAPAFCCVHDAPRATNNLAPNCNTDENCPQYNYCYIAWWKLHDTVGPALFLRVEQDDDFYDILAEEIENDSTGNQLFTQVLLHHFDDINQVIQDGTEGNEFNADRIFLDEEYWVYPITDKVVLSEFATP